MNRRQFLVSVSATLAGASFPPSAFGESTKLALKVSVERALATMPLDFTGFSYESAQLADPAYFAASNEALVAQFRKLSPRGVLRLGGNLSDLTWWSSGTKSASAAIPDRANIKTRFEWRNVGARAGANRPATITPESIRALGSFLKATEWKLIYGLNLGTGTPQRAAEEAACVLQNAGGNLLAFQVGNEPDLFAGPLRRRGWDFNHYWDEYQGYLKAVRAQIPRAPFAGPDVAVNTNWVRRFAELARGDAVLLTSHYYAMGPPEKEEMNAQRLLRRDPRLVREVPMLVAAANAAGLPYRMAEGNSCFHGGKPGVSNTFASALWAADYLLFLAQAGCAGVNLHTGGEGWYAAFVGEGPEIHERPLFYGMQFAQQFAGATFLESAVLTHGRNVAAYAARRGDEVLVAVLNKDAIPVEIAVSGLDYDPKRVAENWVLAAPALDATADVQWQRAEARDSLATLQVPQYSGRLVVLHP